MSLLTQPHLQQALTAHINHLVDLAARSKALLKKGSHSKGDLPQIRALIKELSQPHPLPGYGTDFVILASAPLPAQRFLDTHAQFLERLEERRDKLRALEQRLSPPPSCASKLAAAAFSALVLLTAYYFTPRGDSPVS